MTKKVAELDKFTEGKRKKARGILDAETSARSKEICEPQISGGWGNVSKRV